MTVFYEYLHCSKLKLQSLLCVLTDTTSTEPGGHAVVLMRCDPDCLTFMNSWGEGFADRGFFRVKDESVLNSTKFFDIYWTTNDLKPCEIEAYRTRCIEGLRELSRKFPSIRNLHFRCSKCNEYSMVGEFLGHILEAECPKCHQTFAPTNKEIVQNLGSPINFN